MTAPHVSKGSRVYLTSRKLFGVVVKTTSLGTAAVVVECDDGILRMVCGDDVVEDVVDNDTKKNGRGILKAVPTDVRTIGPQVLASIGVDETTTAALFQKFMVLEESVRLEKAAYWEANKDDAAAMSTFLPELMALLGEDTQFIQTKSAKLLRHLDGEVRTAMLTSMMTKTSAEERKDMIMQYTVIQNDKRKVEEFLQGMYELLLDNKTYVKMEFKRALANIRIYEKESVPMIVAFLADSSEEELETLVALWRQRKYYRSNKGGTYAYSFLKTP